MLKKLDTLKRNKTATKAELPDKLRLSLTTDGSLPTFQGKLEITGDGNLTLYLIGDEKNPVCRITSKGQLQLLDIDDTELQDILDTEEAVIQVVYPD